MPLPILVSSMRSLQQQQRPNTLTFETTVALAPPPLPPHGYLHQHNRRPQNLMSYTSRQHHQHPRTSNNRQRTISATPTITIASASSIPPVKNAAASSSMIFAKTSTASPSAATCNDDSITKIQKQIMFGSVTAPLASLGSPLSSPYFGVNKIISFNDSADVIQVREKYICIM